MVRPPLALFSYCKAQPSLIAASIARVSSLSMATGHQSVVLLQSDFCGTWNAPLYHRNETNQSFEDALWEAKWDTILAKSANFAATCYNKTTPSSNCNAHGRLLLSLSTTTHSDCPFDPVICANYITVRMDPGYVDSLLDLGVNSSPSSRVEAMAIEESSPSRT